MRKFKKALCLLMAAVMVSFTVMGALPVLKVSAGETVDNSIKVSISATDKYANGNAKSSGNAFSLTVSLSRAPITGLSVHYHTEDYGGACAKTYDYNAVSDTLTFSDGVTSLPIIVNFEYNRAVSGVIIGKLEYNRTFRVVIDSVVSLDGEETKIKDAAVICQLPSTYCYETKTLSNGTSYFSEYDNTFGNHTYHVKDVDDDDNNTESGIYSNKSGVYSNWKTYYINPGYAKVYFNPYEFYAHEEGLATSHYVTYSISAGGKSLLYLKWTGEFENYGKSSFIFYGQMYNTYKDHNYVRYERSFLWASWWNSYVNDFQVYYKIINGYILSRDSSGMFIELPENTSPTNYTIKMTVDGCMNHDMWTTIDNVLIDSTAPKIRNSLADVSSIDYDGKFRYSLRFDEPVQVHNANEVSITIKIGETQITMPYLSGSGTDTLTFQCTLTDYPSLNDYYKSAKLISVNGAGYIGDFAHWSTSSSNNKNRGNNRFGDSYSLVSGAASFADNTEDAYQVTGIALDFRIPELSLDNNLVYPEVEEIAYVRTFRLEIDKMTKATLYYSFDDSLNGIPKYDCVKSLENGDSRALVTETLRAENISGEKYLHVKIVTALGKTVTATYYKNEDTISSGTHGYYFSNTPPSLSDVSSDGTADHGRTFDFTVTPDRLITSESKTVSPTIDAVYMSISKDRFGTDAVNYCIYARDDTEYTAVSSADADIFSCRYYETTGKVHVKINGASEYIGLSEKGENTNGTFYIAYYAVDQNGLSSADSKTYNPYRFDMRDTFKLDKVEYTGTSIVTGATVTAGQSAQSTDRVYDISDGVVKFYLTDLKESSLFIDSIRIGETIRYFSPTVARATEDAPYWESAVKDYFDFDLIITQSTSDGTKNDNLLILTPKVPGYVEIVLGKLTGEQRQVSYDVYTMYFTDSRAESTVNYENTKESLVLSNRLFFLNAAFWYMEEDGKYASVNYGNSFDTPVFSSYDQAKQYVMAMEQKDLCLVKLTDQMATFLNNSSQINVINRAEGELKKAEANQFWIRYKRASWSPPTDDSSAISASDWVYYYYCEESENLGECIGADLPSSITSAIESVAKTVVNAGEYRNLVGDYLDENTGEPTIDVSRLHPTMETLSLTVTNSKISPAVVYNGDAKVYANTVKYQNNTYALASNLRTVIHTHSALFYMTNEGYQPIPLKSKTPLRELIPSKDSGVYQLLELDETGVREFKVYLDTEAPKLQVKYVSIETGDTVSVVLEAKNDGISVNGQSIILNGFTIDEIDDMAYVVVYSVGENKVIDVLYPSDFADGYKMKKGTYILEIGDRSGNIYDLNAMISAEKMNVSAEVNDDQTGLYIKVSNRDTSEILRYEIYHNGSLETKDFAASRFFTKNGVYKIYVQDVYGNVFSEYVTFMHKAPSVRWYYKEDDAAEYIRYGSTDAEESETTLMTQKTMETGVIRVLTSGYVAFVVDSGVVVELEGVSKNKDYYVSDGGSTVQYTFLDKTGFSLKVYYEGYEDSAGLYNCMLETTPPAFDVTCKTAKYTVKYSLNDLDTMTEKNGEYIPNYIDYVTTTENARTVFNNTVINSNYIRVKITDESEIISFTAIHDGKLLKNTEIETDKKNGYYLFRDAGTYVLSATDKFGNVSTFTFRNEEKNISEYSTDGNVISGHNNTTTYANSTVKIVLSEESMLYCFITPENAEKAFFWYSFNPNTTVIDKNGKEVTYVTLVRERFVSAESGGSESGLIITQNYGTVFNLPVSSLKEGAVISATLAQNGAYKMTATLQPDGSVVILIESKSDKMTVESRVDGDSSINEPDYHLTFLSKEKSDVSLVSNGETIETNQSGNVIKTKYHFTVDTDNLDGAIVSVSYSFSTKQEFTDFIQIYPKAAGTDDFVAVQNGFYLIRIVNVYGNVTEYVIHCSDTFSVVSQAIYADKTSNAYDSDYSDVIKSNDSIVIRALPIENYTIIFYSVNNAGDKTVLPTESDDDGWLCYTVSAIGDYKILLADDFGVEKTVRCSIGAQVVTDVKDLVTGFPENADKEGGYSKNKLSLDTSEIANKDLHFISVTYGDIVTVLLNSLSQNKVVPDESVYQYCIGTLGDGDYVVTVRDGYGNVANRTVHYRGTDALLVTRTLSSSGEPEPVSIGEITEEGGLFSNYALAFDSAASSYQLIVDGMLRECPATFSLTTFNGDFHDSYDVIYSDVYGYSYHFTAYLIRRTLALSASDTVTLHNINGTSYTGDPIMVVFDEEQECKIFCDYSLDGQDPKPYVLGQKLYDDGQYVFTLSDYAGNTSYLTVVRDTVCEYSFTEEGMAEALVCYGVSGGSVRFTSLNGDSVFISKAYFNGEIVENIESTLFTDGGKWQVLLEDRIGNTSLFTFYILNHSFTEFSYQTPFDYLITKVQQEHGEKDGKISATSYLSQVQTANGRSSFTISDNGTYSVIMKNTYTGNILKFSFVIDNTPPAVTLIGCQDKETTVETVSLAGCTIGDRIRIYKNDQLVVDQVLAIDNYVPEITEGGEYKIVVTNRAGASVSFEFVKESIVNTAASLFIILMILLLSTMLFVGMLLRNRSRIDK